MLRAKRSTAAHCVDPALCCRQRVGTLAHHPTQVHDRIRCPWWRGARLFRLNVAAVAGAIAGRREAHATRFTARTHNPPEPVSYVALATQRRSARSCLGAHTYLSLGCIFTAARSVSAAAPDAAAPRAHRSRCQ